MRAKLFIAGAGLIALAGFLMLGTGCSDSTTSWTAGSETDYDYMLVQPQINHVIDSAVASFSSAFDSYNQMPTGDNDDDVIIANYAPGGGDVNYTYNYYRHGHSCHISYPGRVADCQDNNASHQGAYHSFPENGLRGIRRQEQVPGAEG